jgi:hypothetical protein
MQRNFLALLLLLGPVARAASPVADLGRDLGYLRPTDAVADLPALATGAPASALVLDLRRAAFAPDDARAWLAALHGLPVGKTVRLVLISPATAPELLAGLAAGIPGCITIGRADGGCLPDVVVATDADADARACDALAAGTAAATLATETIDKPRHDEVELGRLHAAGKNPPEEADPETPPGKPAPDAPAPRSTPVDVVLRRAVEIDRGLVALGKINGPIPVAAAATATTAEPQPPSTTNR